MYKDKDKQREANRHAKARQRAKQGMTKGVTGQGMTSIPTPQPVIPKRLEHEQYYHQVHCNAPSHVKQFAKGVSCSCRRPEQPKPQSYNPMMIGYVPPEGEL